MILTCALAAALAAPPVLLEPLAARPGDVVAVLVPGGPPGVQGTLHGEELQFVPGPGGPLALLAVPLEATPGPWALELLVGDGELIHGQLTILPADFRQRPLQVATRFTSPSRAQRRRAAQDRRAMARALDVSAAPVAFRGPFRWPVPPEITAPFGDLRTLNGKTESQHLGLDLDGKVGDVVRASNDGQVVLVRDCFFSGRTVLVHHGARLFTAYFHLSRFAVAQGQQVRAGQELGRVGKTGRVTGPHLHFGVKVAGRWASPGSLLSLRFGLPADAGAP